MTHDEMLLRAGWFVSQDGGATWALRDLPAEQELWITAEGFMVFGWHQTNRVLLTIQAGEVEHEGRVYVPDPERTPYDGSLDGRAMWFEQWPIPQPEYELDHRYLLMWEAEDGSWPQVTENSTLRWNLWLVKEAIE